MPRIKKVTYSKPVTIIRWDDNTITKSFCDEVDNYDELTGFLMCIIKKMAPAKEMRKLFSKYVYGDDPKYIKRITSKKKKKNNNQHLFAINPITLELDPKTCKTNTSNELERDVDDFIKTLDRLIALWDDED